MPLQPSTKLGPYEVVGQLGAGGMGEVYRGLDPRLARDVAIKVLPPQFASDPERLRRFQTEARAAAALNHPNILVVHDVGTDAGTPYVVSELLDGNTLRELLAAGPLPMRRVVEYSKQIAAGLAAAHARGIVHRDIKPENLFVTTDGHVKILDFGLAKRSATASDSDLLSTIADSGSTGAGLVLGTVGYISPEQAAGKPADFRCDQFALGVVLYEMASGQRTFQRPTAAEELAAILRDEPRPLSELNPETPLPLQWLAERCLAKDPAERYESTRDLVRDLETLSEHLTRASKRSARAPGATLPVYRTPLIGRDDDIASAAELVLRDPVRLVTVTGAGGTGKTRLALRVAGDLADRFPGGLFFVSLAATADVESVALAIAEALGAPTAGSTDAAAILLEHLERFQCQPTLLILDSFERAIEAAGLVARLLQLPIPLKILVTSREPLRLYEEHELPVLPLPCPSIGRRISLESLAANPAVALFVERASAALPAFALTKDNASAIAEICRHLDGLPLAIELAASRVKTLPPSAMLGRLQQRLHVLTGGPRDRPERQQTLRGTIAWSYDLLDAAEQCLLRRLACFAGGCSLEAAEAVCDTREDLSVYLLDGIDSLVNKSLLRQSEQPDGEPRLAMLRTIREFGLEKLAESGEEAAVREAHAAYFVVLSEEAAATLEGSQNSHWLDLLDRDRENLHSALDWLCRQGRAEWALRLGSALFPYWQARELIGEGRQRLAAALALPAAPALASLRAKASFAISVLAWSQQDDAVALAYGRDALAVYDDLGDRAGVATTLNAMAVNLKTQGDHQSARAAFEQSLEIWQQLDNQAAVARGLSNLGSTLQDAGEFSLARQRHREAQALFEALGDDNGAAWSLEYQGDLARAQGDVTAAQALYQEALARFAALGDGWGVAGTQTDLGRLALEVGDMALANRHFREALEGFRKLGHRRGLARALEGLAMLAARQDRAERALVLAGVAGAVREELGTPMRAAELQRLEAELRPAQQRIGAGGRSQEWIRGWNMPIEQAMDYALAGDP